MVNNYTIKTTYYDRKMDEKLLTQINERFPWIISYVKSHNCLDFQTGNDPKTNRSWFSIYRGTGRILTFRSHSGKVNEICDVAEAYKELMQPDFFRNPTPDQFDTYLAKIASTEKFKRYYEDTKGVRNEGFYQTLIGRRYTFEVKDTDDFILFDKELVIGFKTKDIKDEWNKEIVDQQTLKIEQLRKTYNGTLPEKINTNGDILIMELKQNDPAKTALSPIQTSYYYLQFQKLAREDDKLYQRIKAMIEQKIDYGLIGSNYKNKIPLKLSGRIIPCVIVGEDNRLSETICERYRFIRDLFLPEMKAYTCTSEGTLFASEDLETE